MPSYTIPQRVLVRKVGGMPYWSIRHKKIYSDVPLHVASKATIVPAQYFTGDLRLVLQSWLRFIGSQPQEVQHSLMLPVVALQEILFRDHEGLIGTLDNRLIGVISFLRSDHSVNISIISPSPYDIVEGRVQGAMHLLHEGLKTYLRSHKLKVEQDYGNTPATA